MLPRSGLGWLLLAANLSRAVRLKTPFGSRQNEVHDHRGTGIVNLGPILRKEADLCRVLVSAIDPLAALLIVGGR